MNINGATNPKCLRALLGGTLLTFAAALGLLWLEVDSSHAGEGPRGALATAARVPARAAKVEGLNELMRMRITKVKGTKVSARGSASGTIAGTINFNLILSSASRAVAEFGGSNASGTIAGRGNASYRVAGPISYFTGTVTNIHGSRKYAHASSLGIQFSGTVNRKTFEVTLRLVGRWHV